MWRSFSELGEQRKRNICFSTFGPVVELQQPKLSQTFCCFVFPLFPVDSLQFCGFLRCHHFFFISSSSVSLPFTCRIPNPRIQQLKIWLNLSKQWRQIFCAFWLTEYFPLSLSSKSIWLQSVLLSASFEIFTFKHFFFNFCSSWRFLHDLCGFEDPGWSCEMIFYNWYHLTHAWTSNMKQWQTTKTHKLPLVLLLVLVSPEINKLWLCEWTLRTKRVTLEQQSSGFILASFKV